MKISRNINLGKSLRQVFKDVPDAAKRVEDDRDRQEATTNAILQRFLAQEALKRELTILADEVGLGKTYVALAVAVSLLEAIHKGETPDGLPPNKPVVLVLTPNNDALFNKWKREAEAFKTDCARKPGSLDWFDIICPVPGQTKSGNILDLATEMRKATRQRPVLLIAKYNVLGAALKDRDQWRKWALHTVFRDFRVQLPHRGRVLNSLGIPSLPELIDFRRSKGLWKDEPFPGLESAFKRALMQLPRLRMRLSYSLRSSDSGSLKTELDKLSRYVIARKMPKLPLVIIDEIHNLKNERVQARRWLEFLLAGRVCRMLGLSATPFQLRQKELTSILKLRAILSLPSERAEALDKDVEGLTTAMDSSHVSVDNFTRRWRKLRPGDQTTINKCWHDGFAPVKAEPTALDPLPRIAHALESARKLEKSNRELQKHLCPFVIRHRHPQDHRMHFVGHNAEVGLKGTSHFSWARGLEVKGDGELAHYLMMRAVALAKEEKGLPGLGAELTGSYRQLAASKVWERLARAKNPLLQKYRDMLETMIGPRTEDDDPDRRHHKVEVTAQRALDFFKQGQKSLIFCFHIKTAESVRDQVKDEIDGYLQEVQKRVFGKETSFKNFRKRFFNRREPLFSLIQDHPLLGHLPEGRQRIPYRVRLRLSHLHQVAEILVDRNESASIDKPDRRLLLAATEHVAVTTWQETAAGRQWLADVLGNCPELECRLADPEWLVAREPLSRSEQAVRGQQAGDPEASDGAEDPLTVEQQDEGVNPSGEASQENGTEAWVRRLRQKTLGKMIAAYFREDVIPDTQKLPLLAKYHGKQLEPFDLKTRTIAGQVFRRTLMAEEFLLRYLADVKRNNAEQWVDYLAEHYDPEPGHLETLRDRVHAYLETLGRATKNKALLDGYHNAAENRNVVQLVKGATQSKDRYFLGFNTPYRPEVLISTSVGQEGIDLHRECRHVIHHDLAWNPATIEQRTGRVDRIGSKVEREGLAGKEAAPNLEIAVPYLAATYDERMFEELYRRARLFEITLGGDMHVEEHSETAPMKGKNKRSETEGEDSDKIAEIIGIVDLPQDMVERLRIDLSVWRPQHGQFRCCRDHA